MFCWTTGMRHAAHILGSVALTALCCHAQAPPEPPYIPSFNQIIKQPTGQNGYEEILMAADLLYHNAALDAARNESSTLTTKRRALADPDLREALSLLRTGLDKPISPPPVSGEINLFRVEFEPMLQLGDLLEIEQYMWFADGDIERGIQNLDYVLRLGYAARTRHTLNAELVGMTITESCIGQTARHLDQFSEHDCDSLLQLVNRSLEVENSPIPALVGKRDALLGQLQKMRDTPTDTLDALRDEADANGNAQRAQVLAAANSDEIGSAAAATAAIILNHFATLCANMQLPPWQQREIKLPTTSGLVNVLFRTIMPGLDGAMQRYAKERASMQLLGVHAALRRYRWQYDRLPERLEQLRLDVLTTDPFTGKPLIYRRKGDDYELYSAGPPAHDEHGNRIPDKREPLDITR